MILRPLTSINRALTQLDQNPLQYRSFLYLNSDTFYSQWNYLCYEIIEKLLIRQEFKEFTH